jgi:hypothetical protein
MVVEFVLLVIVVNIAMITMSYLMVNVLKFVHLEQLWFLENVNLVQVTVKAAQLLTLVTNVNLQKFSLVLLAKIHAYQSNMLMEMLSVTHVMLIAKFVMALLLVLVVMMDSYLIMVFARQHAAMELSQEMADVNIVPINAKLVIVQKNAQIVKTVPISVMANVFQFVQINQP